ncbi:hypothetical protein HispidOSU_010887, partial [Sigmodon hispidus]
VVEVQFHKLAPKEQNKLSRQLETLGAIIFLRKLSGTKEGSRALGEIDSSTGRISLATFPKPRTLRLYHFTQ